MNVLAFGLGSRVIKKGSREYRRMQSYATHLEEYHLIVLTRGGEKAHYVDGNLHVYQTGARTRLGAFVVGFSIAHVILRQRLQGDAWTVTSQDPFLVGFLGLIVSKVERLPHVVQVHGDMFGSEYRAVRKKLGLFIIKHSHRVRVVSERIKNSLLLLGVPAKKITVLPIRAELEAFLNVKGNPEGETVRIVTVGRLAPEKNMRLIIESFAELRKTQKNTVLEIVGSGSEESFLKTRVRELGIEAFVTFTPWTQDIPAVMERTNIFAFASLHEGYALVLLEALAAGVPVVTTDVGCVGELVKDGEHGIVVPVRDQKAFTLALGTLAADSAQRALYGARGKALGEQLKGQSEEVYALAWVATFSHE